MTISSRHGLVDEGRVRADLSVQTLWLRYISLSGVADLLDVDAYLNGLIDLDSYQEDKLSYAVNEELDELHQAARLPYTSAMEAAPPVENPLEVLHELLAAARAGSTDTHTTAIRDDTSPPSDEATGKDGR
jgi:hypothetical protein